MNLKKAGSVILASLLVVSCLSFSGCTSDTKTTGLGGSVSSSSVADESKVESEEESKEESEEESKEESSEESKEESEAADDGEDTKILGTEGVLDLNNFTAEEMADADYMAGTVYYVIDCIAEEYTEIGTYTSTDAYYYAIPVEDNTVMIVKTGVDTETEELMDALYILSDPYYEEYKSTDSDYAAYEEYEYLAEEGVYVQGSLEKNDSEILEYYEEWKSEYPDMIEVLFADYGLECDVDSLEVLPYTLDTTVTEYAL